MLFGNNISLNVLSYCTRVADKELSNRSPSLSSSRASKKKASKEPSTRSEQKQETSASDRDKKESANVPPQDLDKKVKNTEQIKSYTDLEDLQCPELHPCLTCSEIRQLCHHVQLDWCSPAAYFSAAGSKWETLEPEWVEPEPPKTDPSAEREPMLAKFDEIWCPVLADADGSSTIIPPTFQYFSDGTIMHATAY